MPDAIDLKGIGGIGSIGPSAPSRNEGAGGPSFQETLFGEIEKVNALQQQAESAMENFAAGKTENVSEVFVAVQKADLAFKTLMTIRNKLFEAYQEINQLRV